MKRFLTLFALPLVFAACETQPVGVDTPDPQFAKPEKPEKPPKPASAELITFTGDLVGNQDVTGCCPNAGPFPEYTMTYSEATFPPGISGEHTGHIFMNSFGPKAEWDYLVQFWWGEEPDAVYFTEIRGGEEKYDRRTKVLTVTFDQEEMTIIDPVGNSSCVDVSFVLTRAPGG
jgi:hypothetical protein